MNEQNFPEVVEWKSATATIYRTKNRTSTRFEVRQYDWDGIQQRFTFETYAIAKKFAVAAVHELSDSRSRFVTLRGQEAYEYSRSKELLSSANITLLDAVTLAVESQKLLQGQVTPLEAIRSFLKSVPLKCPTITVAETVARFLEFKKSEGEVGPLYLRDLRNRLKKFAEAFQCPISDVTTKELTEYVLTQGTAARTRKNIRTTVNTLFAYARSEGFVPADRFGVPRPGKKRVERCNVQIFSPPEMGRLLEAAKPELAVVLAITAFAGIRAEEVKRLRWEHVKLGEGHIEVPGHVAKTGVRRLAPVPDNLKAWLVKHYHHSGKVSVFSNLAQQYSKVAEKAGVEWKRNGLRHSFVSYRVADLKDIARVALEAGNSPQVIQRDYLKAVSEREAKQWFSIYPESSHQAIVGHPITAAFETTMAA